MAHMESEANPGSMAHPQRLGPSVDTQIFGNI